MLSLNRNTFNNLYQDVEQRFTEDYQSVYNQKPNATQIHGLRGFKEKKLTLLRALQNNPDVKRYLDKINQGKQDHQKIRLSHRYLYNKKKNDYDKKNKEVTLQSPYDSVFFLYLGFKNKEAYLTSQTNNIIEYTGYYYSYKAHEVHKFKLKIDYDRKPNFNNVEKQEYSAEESGFHDNDRDPIYSGYAYRLDGKLHIILWNEKQSDKMKMILDSGDNPSSNKAMRGAILAISSLQGHSPMNLETLLVRNDYRLSKGDRLRIRRYLFLHRYNFRIKAEILNLKAMKAKGTDVHLIENFVGCWRTIRFDDNYENLVVSILHVRADYRITCYTNQFKHENYNTQVCIPDITIINYFESRTLCLASYPNEGAKIISNMMLKIPAGEKKQVGGAILFVAKSGEYPINRSIVLTRDKRVEEFFDKNGTPNHEQLVNELKILSVPEVKEALLNNPVFEASYNFLVDLETENALPKTLKQIVNS